MIPKNVREGATVQNLPGQTQAFTIAANGKAFRTLIDGLYSNKVKAVIRELCSNAADSHIEAGQTRPFTVNIPTSLDPTFRVRDYGVSLTHDQVMFLYTRIFESTKETTNTQTGQLGLGSKSPFAYTDSFSVIAYLDGEKRTYLAFLATDGVPSITHVSTDRTAEPNGLEVMFAAKRQDISSFQREMQFVAMGYPTNAPEVEGMNVKMPEPRLKGNGWAIYARGVFGDMAHNHFIRQGTVIYPTEQAFPHVGYGWITIVDIPIGTAEVTASREALSMDDDTRRALRTIRDSAYRELERQVNSILDAANTRIEKAKVYAEYNGVLDNLRGSTVVSLRYKPDTFNGGVYEPGEEVERAVHFGKAYNARRTYNRLTSGMEYTQLSSFVLLVNDPETKVVRRIKRVQTFGNVRQNAYVLNIVDPIDRAKGVAWITKCFELKPSQIVTVSDLPDNPPPVSARKPSMKRVLKPGQYWMPRWEGCVHSDVFGMSNRGVGEWPSQMVKAANTVKLRLDWDEVFWVTEKQQESFTKKGQLPDSLRLDNVIKAKLDAMVAALPLDDALTLIAIVQMVGQYNKALPVVLGSFFPDLLITPQKAQETVNMAELAQVDLRSRPIVAKINTTISTLIGQYPLLFQKSERKHYEQYVTAIQAAAHS